MASSASRRTPSNSCASTMPTSGCSSRWAKGAGGRAAGRLCLAQWCAVLCCAVLCHSSPAALISQCCWDMQAFFPRARRSHPALPAAPAVQFNKHLFKVEQETYESEGIDWTHVEFEDNQARPKGACCGLCVSSMPWGGEERAGRRNWRQHIKRLLASPHSSSAGPSHPLVESPLHCTAFPPCCRTAWT